MASEEQYTFFKGQYEEENQRYNELTKKSELYFSFISLFLSAVLFKFKDIYDATKELDSRALTIILIAGLCALATALVLLVYSLKVRTYEGLIDIDEFIQKNKEVTQNTEDFYEDRLGDYIVAIKRNTITNDSRAQWLVYAGYFILTGFLFTVTFVVYFLISMEMTKKTKEIKEKPAAEKPQKKKVSLDKIIEEREKKSLGKK